MGNILDRVAAVPPRNLVPCRACGTPISKEAQACPRCGAPPRQLGVLHLLVGVVFVIAIVTFLAREASDTKTSREAPAAPAAPAAVVPAIRPAKPAPPIEVTARQLYKDYDANEVSADGRYRGRTILVTGTVTAIKKDRLNDPFVQLSTGEPFHSVDARFSGDMPALGALRRGEKIRLLCIGNNVVVGDPQLKDCIFQ